MADISVTLKNLLQNLTYQYAMASEKNASNIQSSAKKTTTAKKTATTTKTTTTTAQKASSNLLNIAKTSTTQTSALSNTSTVTNDMVLEFFKSYKNAVTTSIYNKLNNGSSMTANDLSNFQAQVSRLSADEQKLWKSEIAKIEAQIEARIFNKTAASANTSSTAAQNTSSSTTLNGFVNNVLYKNGQKFSGIYSDGKYYQNGVVASGTYGGKVYVNGEAYTGTKSGIYYQNGVAFTGTINGTKYVNGIVQTNTTNNTNTSTSAQTSAVAASANVVSKTTKSNGDVIGYDAKGNIVYIEKTVNGKKVIYDDELNYLNAKTKSYLTSVDESVLTDRMLSDIQILKNAKSAALKAGAEGSTAYQNAYNASIKSQMIKTTSNMTGAAGEVVEKNGSLYVNNGSGLVKLNISANTYLELFPPVERYLVNQNNIGDCYFVSGCLTDMMKNGEAYAKLLQSFSEDSNGNITVKFAGSLKSYPVTFANGQLKTLDGQVNGSSVKKYNNAYGSLGTQMLEQAYAIAKFSESSKKSVTSVDVDEATASISNGGWQYKVYDEVLGIKSERTAVTTSKLESYLNSIASKVNNGSLILSMASYGTDSQYNLSMAHAYSIEKIDTVNKVVYVTNPWYGSGSTAIPYSVFAKAAYADNSSVYFSIGYVNS